MIFIGSKKSHFDTVKSLSSRFRGSTSSIHREWDSWKILAPVFPECSFPSTGLHLPKITFFTPTVARSQIICETLYEIEKTPHRIFLNFPKMNFPESKWSVPGRSGTCGGPTPKSGRKSVRDLSIENQENWKFRFRKRNLVPFAYSGRSLRFLNHPGRARRGSPRAIF